MEANSVERIYRLMELRRHTAYMITPALLFNTLYGKFRIKYADCCSNSFKCRLNTCALFVEFFGKILKLRKSVCGNMATRSYVLLSLMLGRNSAIYASNNSRHYAYYIRSNPCTHARTGPHARTTVWTYGPG